MISPHCAMDLWGSLALPGPIRCLNCFWPFTYFSRDQYQNQSSTLGNENLMKEIKYRIQLAKGQSFSDLYPDLNRWKMGSINIWNGRGFSRTNGSNFYTLTNDPPDIIRLINKTKMLFTIMDCGINVEGYRLESVYYLDTGSDTA